MSWMGNRAAAAQGGRILRCLRYQSLAGKRPRTYLHGGRSDGVVREIAISDAWRGHHVVNDESTGKHGRYVERIRVHPTGHVADIAGDHCRHNLAAVGIRSGDQIDRVGESDLPDGGGVSASDVVYRGRNSEIGIANID